MPSQVSTEMGDCSQVYCLGQLSLVIPPWLGKMSTSDGYGCHYGRNGKFCITAGPVTRIVDILT